MKWEAIFDMMLASFVLLASAAMFEWYARRRTDKPQSERGRRFHHHKGPVLVAAIVVCGAAQVVSQRTGLPLPLAVVGVIAVLAVTVVLVVEKYSR